MGGRTYLAVVGAGGTVGKIKLVFPIRSDPALGGIEDSGCVDKGLDELKEPQALDGVGVFVDVLGQRVLLLLLLFSSLLGMVGGWVRSRRFE